MGTRWDNCWQSCSRNPRCKTAAFIKDGCQHYDTGAELSYPVMYHQWFRSSRCWFKRETCMRHPTTDCETKPVYNPSLYVHGPQYHRCNCHGCDIHTDHDGVYLKLPGWGYPSCLDVCQRDPTCKYAYHYSPYNTCYLSPWEQEDCRMGHRTT